MSVAIHKNYVPGKLLIQRTAIATVETGMATFDARRGIAISQIPMRHRANGVEYDNTDLMHALHEAGKLFIQKMASRGYEFYDRDDLHAFGPYPSYELGRTMHDITEADVAPEHVRELVRGRDGRFMEFADYRLFGNFIAVPAKLDQPLTYQHDHSASGTFSKETVEKVMNG